MQNLREIGNYYYSFVNVDENPNNYTFELGVDYPGNDLSSSRSSPAEPNVVDSVSINDVLAELITNGQNTNFAVFGTQSTGNFSFSNYSWYKDSSIVPGVYTGTTSSVPSTQSLNGENSNNDIRLSVKYQYQPNQG